MALSSDFLQELKYRCDIESIVSKYVNLRKSGRSLSGLCPFHSEKTPSFHVFPDNQSFYCFGCETGGDVITFIRKIENLDYIEAVKYLAQLTGLEVPLEEDRTAAVLRQKTLEINREAARFFYQCLMSPQGATGMRYFEKRQLSLSTIRGFGLGYAPDSWDALLRHLTGAGYAEAEIYAASLIVKGRKGNFYDQFRNRVMFPIIDLRGNVIAFGGRVMDDGQPKYLNSADSPVFKKSRNLFALNFAKNGNTTTGILCEGYMDVISMHQAGFKNAFATLGTALTPDQSRLLSRYFKEVIISYDSDAPGQKAAKRAIGLLTQAGLSVRVLRMEGGKDPDEFIKTHGADKFRLLLEKCGNHIEYRLTDAKSRYDVGIPEQKVAFLKEAAAILATVENRMEREVYAGRIAEELSVSKESILDETEKILRRSRSAGRREKLRTQMAGSQGLSDRINPEKSRYLKAARAEENLIVLLCKNPDFLSKIDALLSTEDFVTAFNQKVYRAARGLIEEQGEATISALGAYFTPEEISKITSLLVTRQVSNTMEEARDCAEVVLSEKRKEQVQPDQLNETQVNEFFTNIRKKKLEEKNKTGGSLS